jgi:amino-acid N-acetyltransferase
MVVKANRKKNALQASFLVEKAATSDAQSLHDLIGSFAEKGEMLPRTMGEVYENLRDFFVVRQGDAVIACVALHIVWEDLAEVRSLAVRGERQALGLGGLLVEACVDEARSLGLSRVFALTLKPGFFERLGFSQADVMTLPRKVWNECYRCSKFPNCDEIAMVIQME